MSEVAFLLDANMPRSAVDVFRARRLVVTDVRDLGGALATDDAIMDYAAERRLIVVTRDKGFGEVLRRLGHPGALILRLPSAATAREVSDRLARFRRGGSQAPRGGGRHPRAGPVPAARHPLTRLGREAKRPGGAAGRRAGRGAGKS